MDQAAIEELLAKQEITEVLYRYCRGIDRLERRNGQWKIAHRIVVFEWTRIAPVGDQFEVGPEVDMVRSRRDRDDPSYAALEHRAVTAAH